MKLSLLIACLLSTSALALSIAEQPAPQQPPPQPQPQGQPPAPPAGGRQGGGRAQGSPASQKPPATVTPQAYPPEAVQQGQVLFASFCGFCHGRDAMGGETGPDLTRSPLVAEDVRGDKIIPLVHTGRAEKGMPPQNLPDADLNAIVAFIHDAKTKADSLEGNRRTVDAADLATGNADAGRRFFEGPGGCTKCHSATGDLAGIGSRLQGLQLFQRMLMPGGRGRGATPARSSTATIKLPSGQTVRGKVAYRDEFTIAITDADGYYRSYPTRGAAVTVDNPLEGHIALLPKYTNDDMHNVLAYLQTLK
jgi:cytochrome c oxidase cbb3-type subunit 3